MLFRVQTRLLRYVLLHVDGKTLPRPISTQARDPFKSNPVDDFDDSPRAMDMPLPMPVSNVILSYSLLQIHRARLRVFAPRLRRSRQASEFGTRDLAGPQWP
jgi:hypothetical protein